MQASLVSAQEEASCFQQLKAAKTTSLACKRKRRKGSPRGPVAGRQAVQRRRADVDQQQTLRTKSDQQHTLRHCVICFEETEVGTSSQNCAHFVCATCLDSYVKSELDAAEESDRRLKEVRDDGGNLRCPCRTDGCSGFFSDGDLGLMLPQGTIQRYSNAKRDHEEHRRWQEEHSHETDPEVLREGLLRDMPNAKQCGRCGFGPIEHYACADLASHHNQWVQNWVGSYNQIKNECPRCGWWARSSSDWPAWDGNLPKTD
jgi:hypothetical protein